jgi:hypothetical protein
MSSASRPITSRNRRPVVDPDGKVYPAVVDAAVAYGFAASNIWLKVRLQRQGWRFLDEEPRQPAAPSPSRGE